MKCKFTREIFRGTFYTENFRWLIALPGAWVVMEVMQAQFQYRTRRGNRLVSRLLGEFSFN